jgi:hypothetical protein
MLKLNTGCFHVLNGTYLIFILKGEYLDLLLELFQLSVELLEVVRVAISVRHHRHLEVVVFLL